MRNEKMCNITLIYGQIAEIFAYYRKWVKVHDSDVRFKTGSGNMAFRACTMKNMQ